jgi:hypothetical protein
MTLTLCRAALVLAILPVQAGTPGSVVSPAHRFQVSFPAAAAASSVPLPSGAGTVDRWRWEGDGILLFLDVSPAAGGKDADPAKALETGVAFLKNRAKITVEEPFTVDGVTGRALSGTMSGGFISGRYFVRDGKLYQVYGATEVTATDQPADVKKRLARITAYMDTFHFAR